jgi:SAM-dependent methyltransferase
MTNSSDLERQIEREFLAMPLRPKTMVFYSPRAVILASVSKEAKSFRGRVLDIGCGLMPYRKMIESNPRVEKYVGMDLAKPTYYGQVEPDLKWDGETIPLDDESVDCAMATEFLEHYSAPEKILLEIRRVLKPGGRFYGTVPFIWNLHEIPYDEYRYTPYSLERHLKNAGYRNIEIKSLGGWNCAFAQMIGLWIHFSAMRRSVRLVLRWLLFPFYVLLLKTDRQTEGFDGGENSMFSGLSVTAEK